MRFNLVGVMGFTTPDDHAVGAGEMDGRAGVAIDCRSAAVSLLRVARTLTWRTFPRSTAQALAVLPL
jgi:hypothetical protein